MLIKFKKNQLNPFHFSLYFIYHLKKI